MKAKKFSLNLVYWLAGLLFLPGLAQAQDAGSALLEEINKLYRQVILPVAAFLTVAMLVYSGILYAASEGQPEKIARAKEYTIGAIAGFLLILTAGLIVKAVTSSTS